MSIDRKILKAFGWTALTAGIFAVSPVPDYLAGWFSCTVFMMKGFNVTTLANDQSLKS